MNRGMYGSHEAWCKAHVTATAEHLLRKLTPSVKLQEDGRCFMWWQGQFGECQGYSFK